MLAVLEVSRELVPGGEELLEVPTQYLGCSVLEEGGLCDMKQKLL